MLTRRIIVCLDVSIGRVVKGTRFLDLTDRGDPAKLAERYEQEGADEIVFLDVAAHADGRSTTIGAARRTAERLSIPLTVGGGIRSIADIRQALRCGADKVSINSAAVTDRDLVTHGARLFGSQCIVVSIDARRRGEAWEVYTNGGVRATGLDAVEWAREAVERGAGELLVTSIDRDGTREGYDLELLRAVRGAVNVPLIASGGAGSAAHVIAALTAADADAALVAGIVHDGSITVSELKTMAAAAGLCMRDNSTEAVQRSNVDGGRPQPSPDGIARVMEYRR